MKPIYKGFQVRLSASFLIVLLVLTPLSQIFAQEILEDTSNNGDSVLSEIQIPEEEKQSEDTEIQEQSLTTEDNTNVESGTGSEQDATLLEPDPTPYNLKPADNIKRSLADVDVATGALNYSYPLRIPQGRRGMQPNLALAYNSQSNEEGSLFGFGWALTLPSIERKNLNGTNKLYTSHDFTSPDGDLEYVRGSGNSIIFKTKIDNGDFKTYTLHNESTGGWWSISSKDGITIEYGNQSDARLNNPNDSTKVFRWYITKVTDTLGNFVDYNYTKVGEQVYPENITYTNNGSNSGIFNIEFVLENRSDIAINAKPGFIVTTTKRIQRIKSYISSSLVGEYHLQYSQDSVNNRSKLSSIQFTGYDENSQPTIEPTTSFTYNSLGDSGLLSQITESTGGNTIFEYKSSTQYRDNSNNLLNPKLPFAVFTVSQITYNDGNGISWNNNYEYAGGWYYYNGAFDRKFVGFEKVVKNDPYGNKTISYFHQGNGNNNLYEEQNDHWAKAGKLYKLEEEDSLGNLYYRVINLWDIYDLGNSRSFVKLSQSLEQTFDGDSTHKDRASSYSYDNANGNLLQQIEWGEVIGQSSGSFADTGIDKFTSTFTYADNSTSSIFLPATETKFDQNSSKIAETKHYYDNLPLGQLVTGNETKTEQWVNGTNYINTEKVYNSLGLVTLEKDPRDKETTYVYDSYNLYPTTVTNALDQTTTYEYDYSLGKPKRVIDPNSRSFYTDYDGLDRVISERQPDLNNPSNTVVKTSYEYTDTPNAVRTKTTNYLNSTNAIESYVYFDGLGRKIQERQESSSSGQFNVRDFIYTEGDLLLKESLPYESSGSARTTATTNNALYTNYSYDALKRVTSALTAVGTTTNVYDDWKTTITDAKGKTKDIYKDAYDNLIKVDEHNGAAAYTTNYEWNYLKKLKKITDALGNIRNFSYDGLARVLSAEDLHAASDTSYGVWNYVYDEASNLIERTDPNGTTASYNYDDLNRIFSEEATNDDTPEVTYEYDNCSGGIGRLCVVANSTTVISKNYNALGNVVSERKRLGRAYFDSAYTYDRLGNQLEITNPDGSQLKYSYDNAGLVNKIERKEAGDANFTDVISSASYNPVGLPLVVSYANGATTTNTYDANELYRLRTKVTVANNNNVQSLTYTYDPVGNITQIVDDSATATAKTTNYNYDDLHRLLSATITDAAEDSPGNSVQSFTYDAIGNVTYKSDVGSYSYDGNVGDNYANPHAVTGAGGKVYQYDRNGNIVHVESITTPEQRNYTWDYNNRLLTAKTEKSVSTYGYDAGGQRIKAVENSGTTFYITREYTLEPSVTEKHVFLGDTAVATVRTSGTEIDTYNIHADHLTGSNVITDASENIDELTDYFAFGTMRIDEQNGAHNEKRKFTGHEYDVDTWLTYANARYYDSATGRWLSQDPVFLSISDPQKTTEKTEMEYPEYLANPQFSNSYSYVANNPLKYKDQTGDFLFLAVPIVVYAPIWIPAVITATAAVTATVASYNLGQAIKNTAKGDYKAADKNLNTVEGSLGVAAVVTSGGLAASEVVSTRLANNAKVADKISQGHAYDKHPVQRGEFKGIVNNRSDFKTHIENVMNKPSNIRSLEGGRTAYLQKSTNTIVIKDPQSRDYGTAFQPSTAYHKYKSTYEYFKKGLK